MCVCARVLVAKRAITSGYSPAAYIDFLIGKLDRQSSSLPPHPPVCSEGKPAEFTAAFRFSLECSLACRADSSRFSCHRQSSASVIKGLRCVQGNLTGWFTCSLVSFQPWLHLPVGFHGFPRRLCGKNRDFLLLSPLHDARHLSLFALSRRTRSSPHGHPSKNNNLNRKAIM